MTTKQVDNLTIEQKTVMLPILFDKLDPAQKNLIRHEVTKMIQKQG